MFSVQQSFLTVRERHSDLLSLTDNVMLGGSDVCRDSVPSFFSLSLKSLPVAESVKNIDFAFFDSTWYKINCFHLDFFLISGALSPYCDPHETAKGT